MKANKRSRRDAKRLFRLCLVHGLLDEARARDVAQRVARNRSRRRLVVLTLLRRLIRLDRERQTADVQSATPLPADLQSSVRARLARVYGPDLSFSFTDAALLIGGMRVKVGSDVYDSSVRARLAALAARF